MDRRSVLGRVVTACVAGAWCPVARGQGGSAVWVAVASSAQRAMDELVPAWGRATGYRWSMSYGAPGRLVQQISEGMPAQLFLAAADASLASGNLSQAKRELDMMQTDLLVALQAHGFSQAMVELGNALLERTNLRLVVAGCGGLAQRRRIKAREQEQLDRKSVV